MNGIFDIIFSVSFAHAVLRVTTPILLASMGALISKKGGVNNIGLEGIMLFGALVGVLVSGFSGSAFLGVLGAVVIGMLMALLLGYCSLKLKSDIFLTGIALNLMASGGTVFLLYAMTGDKGMSGSIKSLTVPNLDIPIIRSIPVIGQVLNNQSILTYMAFLAVPVVFLLLYKTPIGLRIRAVGEAPNAASSVGVKVIRIKYIALALSGLFAGLGGAFMSMSYVSWFSRDMTAGRGFIALAVEAMGRGNPVGTLVSSLLFGFADALSSSLQAMELPIELLQMLPYLVTVVGLLLYSMQEGKKKSKKKADAQKIVPVEA